jgi:hypothetical protein
MGRTSVRGPAGGLLGRALVGPAGRSGTGGGAQGGGTVRAVRHVRLAMMMSGRLRAALLFSVGVLLLAGCGDAPVSTASVALPEITMTSGGGFETSSQVWKIAPDGSWTWVRVDKQMSKDDVPSQRPPRNGRLTETQRRELAVLATDPRLRRELRRAPGHCNVSDGAEEHLDVGSIKYLANWCNEIRPRIQYLRARIVSLTAGS